MKMKNVTLLIIIILAIALVFFMYKTNKISKRLAFSLDDEKGSFLKNVPSAEEYVAAVANRGQNKKKGTTPAPEPEPIAPISFFDSFSTSGSLEEGGSIYESTSPDWWVNSGGRMISSFGNGKTVQNELATTDKWYKAYLISNPIDTDLGFHPQNIFRLVQLGAWSNMSQQAYFKINKLNVSESTNRNASNGLLLFNRYQSGDNLYYTGLRVDGAAVIKKKINGTYYTMAYNQVISGVYNRISNPNLLPVNTWIGIKSEVVTGQDNSVVIKFYIDINRTGTWTLAAQATDDSKSFGGSSIINSGFAGIRTHFIDAEFDDYSVRSI